MDLTTIASENETAKNVFEMFSNRERFRRETNLMRLQRTLLESGKKVDFNELVNVFTRLQDQGIGTLVVGRGNRMSRFIWHYNLREVAKAAATGKAVAKKSKLAVEPSKAKSVKPADVPIVITSKQLEALINGILNIRNGGAK